MSGPLNLQDADLKGFDAIPADRYNAEVFEMAMDAVKNADGQGKMPAGTPMIKVTYRITDGEYENRKLWQTLVIPPEGHDAKKAAQMKGMVARLFIALGDSEENVLNKKFAPDFDDYIGRPCVIVVGKEPKKTRDGAIIPDEFNNPVKGVKPAGSIAGAAASSVL